MQATTTNSTQEPLTCAGCGHPIQEGQSRLSDVPENMPEGVGARGVPPLSPELPSMSGQCNLLPALRLSADRVRGANKDGVRGVRPLIAPGQNVFRDYHFVWNLGADSGDTGEVSGRVAGMRPPANRPVSFEALQVD